MSRRNILPYLFDIKHTDAAGEIDLERLKRFKRTITLERKKNAQELAHIKGALQLSRVRKQVPGAEKQASAMHEAAHRAMLRRAPQTLHTALRQPLKTHWGLEGHSFLPTREKLLRELAHIEERDRKLALLQRLSGEVAHTLPGYGADRRAVRTRLSRLRLPIFSLPRFSPFALRLGVFAVLGLIVAGGAVASRNYLANTRASVYAQGVRVYAQMRSGIDAALARDFAGAGEHFSAASSELARINGAFRIAGRSLALIADTFPFSSQTASGAHLVEAAEHFARAGEALSAYAAVFSQEGFGDMKPQAFIAGYVSGADLMRAKTLLGEAVAHLNAAAEELAKTDEATLPQEFQQSIATLKQYIPQTLHTVRQFAAFQDSLFDVFGYLGPRKYLVVFQNNAELRATGGFIGSYALVELLDGKITKLFIDDVFNIDGQLVEKVVPPFPIQKISTAWSLHDANWFFDYPTSAKKIAWFYEKTGGATVDGVLAITPELLKKLLAFTGPLALPGYGIELTQENFQNELSFFIEEGAHKKEGESSKVVLRDIGTLLIDALRARISVSGENTREAFVSAGEALAKKDLMLWLREPAMQEFLADKGWGGSIEVPDGDYLAVVHTNINGYKTDRVVKEEISHSAEILADGSVVDTVVITRTHSGSPDRRYDALYEKVNADYLRVYVPKGSRLLEAAGYTPETVVPPLNYAEANFALDQNVQDIENSITVHESGTHVFEESGKTVFGNWVYVSPGESVTVRYVYELPWKIGPGGKKEYTMHAQKQPGTSAKFTAAVTIYDGGIEEGNIPHDVLFDKDLVYRAATR